ncbi:MAG: hypothetical protein RBR02_11220, partial [Desulfuromonadaceae bacterium]|nr:hypothetical protein [Desulfuromonadaceae bacterium]
TAALAFNADAAAIEAALSAALTPILGAEVDVVDCTVGIEDAFDITFGGTLAGVSLPLLKVTATPDATLPSGTFTIGYDAADSQVVTYDTDMSALAANIEAALRATSYTDGANVTVTYDATNSTATSKIFLIENIGELAKTDANDNFWTNDTSLVNASTKLYFNKEGYADSAETQRVSFTTDAKEFSFTLGFAGDTTATISSTMSIAEMQAIIDTDLNADIKVLSFTGESLELSFTKTLAGVDQAAITVTPTTDTTEATLTTTQEGSTTIIEAKEANAIVVDYKAMADANNALEVLAGTGVYYTLNMDGSIGEYLRVSGYLDVNVFNFFSVDGNFAIEKTTSTMTLNTGESVNVDMLTLGANGANAFVGVNGGSSDAIGIEARDTDFALVIANDKTVGSSSTWTTLSANVGSAGFIGVEGLTLNASNLNVEINRTSESGANARYLDYAIAPLEVKTGSGEEDVMNISIDGTAKELTQISGEMEINLFNFFSTSGSFALKKSTMYDIALKDEQGAASSIDEAEVLTLGAAGVDAFIGMNGDSEDALGLRATDVNFALALINNKANTKEHYTSLQATVGSVAFEGIDDLVINATDMALNINSDKDGKVVDYASMTGEDAFEVLVGTGESITLDMDGEYGELLQASGTLEINMFNFIALEGSFGFEKSTREVTLNSGEEIKVDYMSIGGTDISAFAGLNYGDVDAIGLSLGDMDFGLALMKEQEGEKRSFTSLQADAASGAFIGVDGLTIAASDLKVYLNQGVEVEEIPEQTIKVNTTLELSIAKDVVGAITLTKDALTESFSVDAKTSDATIIAELTAAFASLANTPTANIEVSGTRASGFIVEFIGALEGVNVDGFTIATTAPTITSSVTEINAAQEGRNEITTLVIDTPRIIAAPVYTEVFALSSSTSGINEVQSITFKDAYNAGTYALSNGVTTVTNINFVGSQTLTNETNIQAALVSLYGGTTADYKVKFDTKSKNGHTYVVTFQGTKAHTNVASLTATPNADMGAIVTTTKTQGEDSAGSIQHFSLTTEATGSYTLSLN